MNTHKRLVVVGECMLELSGNPSSGNLKSGFAGDTYNAAVYAKRWANNLQVSFLTAIGHDHISKSMLEQISSENIDPSLILRSKNRQSSACVKTITLSDISLKTGSKDPKHSLRSRGQLSSFTLCKLRFLYATKVARPLVAVSAKLRLACFCLISLSLTTF